MAQYRAIFNNAYFKGLATAAVVTVGLAAGQAQAANGDAAWFEGLPGDAPNKVVNVDGTFSIAIGEDKTNAEEFTLKITNGAEHAISAKSATAVVQAENATLIIEDKTASNDANKTKLSIKETDTNSGSLTVKDIKVNHGTLDLAGNANTLVSAQTISVGVNGNAGTPSLVADGDPTAVISVGAGATLGEDETAYTLNQGGQLKLSGATVKGKSLQSNGGSISFAANNDWTIPHYVEGATGAEAQVQNIDVAAERSATIKLAGDETTDPKNKKRGVLHFAEGSTITLTSHDTTGGSLVIDSGSANVGSKVILNSGVKLVSTKGTTGGTVSIKGVGSAEEKLSELSIHSTVLNGFLNPADTDKNAKGGIYLDDNAKLTISDTDKTVVFGDAAGYENAIKLDLVAGKAAAANGKITANSGATTGNFIEAANVVVNAKVENLDKLTLSADNLTLGKAGEDLSKGLGAAFEAKNVNFIGKDYETAYTLADKLTLSSTTKTDDGLKATAGTISASNSEGVIVTDSAKGLVIDGGIYSADSKITVKSGSLTVKNSKTGPELSKLTLSQLALDNSGANTITISGANDSGKDYDAVLSIYDADLNVTADSAGNNATTITVGSNGMLEVSGDNLLKLINKDNSWGTSKSGAGILISGGTVDTLLSDLGTLDVADITSGSNAIANKIVFNTNSGGNLDTQNLTLTDTAGAGLDIGGKSTIYIGGTLTIKANAASGDFVVKTGNFVLAKGLDSSNNAKLVLGQVGSGLASLQLGDIYAEDEQIKHTAESANIAVDLKLVGKDSSDKSTLDVAYGNWTAKKIDATNATITIGSDEFKVDGAADQNDQDLKFGLTADSLALNAGATAEVFQNLEGSTQDQELVVGALTTTEKNAITLHGDMTLKGKLTQASGNPDKFGLALTDDAISVKQGGTLTITDAALAAIKVEGNTVTIQDNAYDASGSLVSNTGSTVKLDFAKDIELSSAALTELRKQLFGLTGDAKLDGTLNVGAATIDGLPTVEDGKVSWSDLAPNKDIITDTTNDDLANATVTGITENDEIRGNFGAITSTEIDTPNGQIKTDERLTLNDADNGYFAAKVDSEGKVVGALGFNVKAGTDLTLNNGGKAGDISLQDNSGLVIGGKTGSVTELTKVAGGESTALDLNAGTLQVTNDKKSAAVAVGEVNTAIGTTLKVDTLTVSADTELSDIKGNLDVTTKDEFKGQVKLSGQDNKLADVKFEADSSVLGGKTAVQGKLELADDKELAVLGGATLDVKTLKAAGNQSTIVVGQVSDKNNDIAGSTGVLSVEHLDLNGASLVVDPDFGQKASFAGAERFGKDDKAQDAGVVNGNIYALQNAIASIGNKDEKAVKSVFAKFIDAKGSLQDPAKVENGVGAIAYVAKKVTIDSSSKIVVDPSATDKTYGNNAVEYANGDLYLGEGAALAVDVSALKDNSTAAITFNKTGADAIVYAKDSTKTAIYVTGSLADIQKNSINLFANKDQTHKVNLELGNTAVGAEPGKLTVQTINGLYAGSITEGEMNAPVALEFQTAQAKKTFSVVSTPVKETLLAAGAGFHDYAAKQPKDKVLGDVADGITKDGNDFYYGKKKADDSNKLDASKPADKALLARLDGHTVVNNVVYFAPENELLENILVNGGNPVDAETVARLAVFGGAPQAALEAGSATYGAIASRMGIGANSGVTLASNTQGGALWVTPVYKNADYDGFNADDKSYGSEVNLYGVALGADFAVAPNFTVGAMFNVGSGDADGQGLGSNVSNDFNYYGFGLYAGYSMDAFSLVGDVTYTTVDNDLEGNTDLGKATTSIDSTNLSVGVTGQYKLALAGMDVTPHAGIRFSTIEIDDYSLEDASYSSDKLNVFSVPVGVTFAKDYAVDAWTLKPSFDLTLTGNFGDDEAEGTVDWAGYSNLSTDVKAEIIDSFTYGAAFGFSATNGNFGLGIGLNYTGSSNTDSFGVNANARYMF